MSPVDDQPPTVLCRIDDGVASILLNRAARRNALSESMLDALIDTLTACGNDPAVRSLILTGDGSVFSAGADLSTVAGLDPQARAVAFAPLARRIASRIRATLQCLLALPKPVVAAVNGHAVGGGLILALGCDLRLVSREARAWMPELGFGRAIGTPSLEMLVACVGQLRAKDIVLGRERLTSERMLQFGLASAVVDTDTLLARAREEAASLSNCDSEAIARNKLRANAKLLQIWHGADD